MEKQPQVSIITITYNLIKAKRKKFFHQCLESVHSQTYNNIEHVIVDGASTDGTVSLIKEYAKKGWVKYISEPDDGIYDALNKGVKLAHGKYIAFLNTDDYYHNKDGIKKTVEILESTQADFSYAPATIISKEGAELNITHPQLSPEISHVFFTMPFCHQTMFTKKSVLLKENMFNTKYRSAGDYDLVVRLCLKNYKSVLVDKLFVTFRLGGISDKERRQSLNEIAKLYYENFSKLVKITKEECENIYSNDYKGIPLKLAKKLKKLKPYFDYNEYMLQIKKETKNSFKKPYHQSLGKFLKYLINPIKTIKSLYNKIKYLESRTSDIEAKENQSIATIETLRTELEQYKSELSNLRFQLSVNANLIKSLRSQDIRTNLEISNLGTCIDCLIKSPKWVDSKQTGFNGQVNRKKISLDIINSFKFDAIIETGTWIGDTAGYMATKTKLPVFSCELNNRFYSLAKKRLKDLPNVTCKLSDSRVFLKNMAKELKAKTVFIYLDAHWYEDLPLFEEIEIICSKWKNFVIMIDDFKVPKDKGYGYDNYGKNKALTMKVFGKIFSRLKLTPFFPSLKSDKETGEKRGCVILTKKGRLSRLLTKIKSIRKIR